MIASIQHRDEHFKVDLSNPIDISLPINGSDEDPSAWYVEPTRIEPVMSEQFIGSVEKGGTVNFRNIFFNPHGNGTHTECVGHIAKEVYSVNDALTNFFFLAEVISITPVQFEGEESEWKKRGDLIITKSQIEENITGSPEPLIIRTLPNMEDKMHKHYSNTNWPYLEEEAAEFIREIGIEHLLIDLPSVDREMDGGKMLAHRAFWNYPENTRKMATITELVYVPTNVPDSTYLLNLQIASFNNDASPSKPVLHQITK